MNLTFFLLVASCLCHTNNWAIIINTSKFWFNYRHMANSFSIYHTIKRLGIPDEHIILMMADDVACNTRNPFPAQIFNNVNRHLNVYGESIEVDYRGDEVTVENFIRLMTGRLGPNVAKSKRLDTDSRSNIFIYMTGHGGDGFLKFQDTKEITSMDLADMFQQMYEKKRYNEILFMIDTCQAATMYETVSIPNFIGISSSVRNQSSYSHHVDHVIGVPIIDRFSNAVLEFMKDFDVSSQKTLQDLIASWAAFQIISDPHVRTDLYPKSMDKVLLTEFFGNVQKVELTNESYEIKQGSEDHEYFQISDNLRKEENAERSNRLFEIDFQTQKNYPIDFKVSVVVLIVLALLTIKYSH